MNMVKRYSAIVAGVMMMTAGCMVYEMPTSGDYDNTTTETEIEFEPPEQYVDAYVAIPYEVKTLIASRVSGYAMPPVSRYSYKLYPTGTISDGNNIPSYVQSDFNGDGYNDYAYMFSKVRWADGSWYLTTKMLVVVSSQYGYKLALELKLGTITASQSYPVEEYWAIRLLRAGSHSITTYYNGVAEEQGVDLEEDGIYLGSLDPAERSVFYVLGTDVHEIRMDLGSIAKRKVTNDTRGSRIIQLDSK